MNTIYTLDRKEAIATLINNACKKGGPITSDQFNIAGVERLPAMNRSLVTIEGIGKLVGRTSIQVRYRSFYEILGTDEIDIYSKPYDMAGLLRQIKDKYRLSLVPEDFSNASPDLTGDSVVLYASNQSVFYDSYLKVNFKERVIDVSSLLPDGLSLSFDWDDVPEGKLNATYMLDPIDLRKHPMDSNVLHSLSVGDVVGDTASTSLSFKLNDRSPLWSCVSTPKEYNFKGAIVVSNELIDAHEGLYRIIVKLSDIYCTNYSGLVMMLYK